MIFRGHTYRKTNNIVTLPIHDKDGNLMPYVDPKKTNFTYFGRVVPEEQWGTKDVYETQWSQGGPRLHAKVIPLFGHGLTNNAITANKKHLLLFKDGKVYMAKIRSVTILG